MGFLIWLFIFYGDKDFCTLNFLIKKCPIFCWMKCSWYDLCKRCYVWFDIKKMSFYWNYLLFLITKINILISFAKKNLQENVVSEMVYDHIVKIIHKRQFKLKRQFFLYILKFIKCLRYNIISVRTGHIKYAYPVWKMWQYWCKTM